MTRVPAAAASAWKIVVALGAARRVANAVEARREPEDVDLLTLGITSKLPMRW